MLLRPLEGSDGEEFAGLRGQPCCLGALDARTKADHLLSLVDAGTYQDELGAFLNVATDLAQSSPDDVSPFAPPFTNWQFALFVGASGMWHFLGGYFDEFGVPTGLRGGNRVGGMGRPVRRTVQRHRPLGFLQEVAASYFPHARQAPSHRPMYGGAP
jgi:hypothetical protein